MTIRSRIGDLLFAVLFPRQAEMLAHVEDAVTDAAIMQARAEAALGEAQAGIAGTKRVLNDVRDLAARLTGPGV